MPASNKAVSPTAEFEQQISIIDFIGELLSEAPNIIDSPTEQGFIANHTRCIDESAKGRINLFSDLVGIWSGTIRRLLTGRTKPRIEVLHQICTRLKISPLDLLSGKSNEEVKERQRVILGRGTPMPKKKVPWNEVEGRLHMALQELPPSSMEEVVRRMGYYQPKLRRHFPKLCSQIVARYKEHFGVSPQNETTS